MTKPEIEYLWHTLPLHYVPYLLHTGALLSAAQIASGNHPLVPRASAIRRKTKLGLADFVHLSLSAQTRLLLHKQSKGYPHALIAFDRAATLAVPGAALLKYNTKRWGHRDDFVPVTDAGEKEVILREHAAGKYPSLEVLVPKRLSLSPFAHSLQIESEETSRRMRELAARLGLSMPPLSVSPLLSAGDADATFNYFARCMEAGAVLPPPPLPFD